MHHDYDALRWQELADISEFLHTIDESDWDHPSLCTGWRVRDVIGHLSLGYTTPMGSMVGQLARYRFNVPEASRVLSVRFASERSPAELLAVFDTIHRDHVRRGITKVIKTSEGLVDHVIHHTDVRLPLGRPRTIPTDRLVAALDAAPKLGGFVRSKQRAAGLRLVAADIGWSWGDGPVVKGSGESILLALSGRPAGLVELAGEGVDVLRRRVAA